MSDCRNCGAPIGVSASEPISCRFCGTLNQPPPKEVPVPVQVVHNLVQVVGESAVASELRCPHCRKRLVGVRAKDVELSGCGACGGIWIDNTNARRVLDSPQAIFAELSQRAGDNAKKRVRGDGSLTCAACPALLDEVVTHEIVLDVCGEHGTWFDAFELKELVSVLRGEKPAGPRRRSVRCQTCNAVIEADRANLTDEGLACEICWRGRQARILAIAAEKEQVHGAVAVGGVLLGVAAAMLGAAGSSRS
jgi:Zn-finger nucleic acid-binding protein